MTFQLVAQCLNYTTAFPHIRWKMIKNNNTWKMIKKNISIII
jgi:hypothetical protein